MSIALDPLPHVCRRCSAVSLPTAHAAYSSLLLRQKRQSLLVTNPLVLEEASPAISPVRHTLARFLPVTLNSYNRTSLFACLVWIGSRALLVPWNRNQTLPLPADPTRCIRAARGTQTPHASLLISIQQTHQQMPRARAREEKKNRDLALAPRHRSC